MIIKPKKITGAPHDTKRFRSFDLLDYVEPIKTEVHGQPRRMAVKAQLTQLERFMRGSMKKGNNSVLCISGQYSDMRAMQVATHLAPSSSKWHRVVSGFHDDLLAKKPHIPMLILYIRYHPSYCLCWWY